MTAQTPRYGLVYPTGSDNVDTTPATFKAMTESMENALGQVDDRQTDEAVKPVVRPTLAQLAEASGVTGQTGYVTADTTESNNGAYVWSGSAWVKVATQTWTEDLVSQGYESGTFTGSTNADAVAEIKWTRHSTAPKSVVITRLRQSSESDLSARTITPTLWSVTDLYFWARFWNGTTSQWATNYNVAFTWLAVW